MCQLPDCSGILYIGGLTVLLEIDKIKLAKRRGWNGEMLLARKIAANPPSLAWPWELLPALGASYRMKLL